MRRSASARLTSLAVWAFAVLLVVGLAVPLSAFGTDSHPCLGGDSGAEILPLLPGGKDDRDLSISPDKALLLIKVEPVLHIRLEHPLSPAPKERFVVSPNFRIVLQAEDDSPKKRAHFAKVAGEILKRDKGRPIWSACRSPQSAPPRDPRLDQAPPPPPPPPGPKALSPYELHLAFFARLMAALGGVLLLLCGLAFWQRKRLLALRDRLDRKREAVEAGTPPLRGAWWKCTLAPLVLLLPLGWMVANFGQNIEAVSASLYLYPYSFLTAETTRAEAEPVPCENGFFRQATRPMFGICVGGQRLALLQSDYISALPYWPTTLIARAVPALAGGALVWLSLIPVFLSLVVFNYLLARRLDWRAANAASLVLLAYPILICYIAVWFQDDAMAYKMLFLEWLFLDLWNQKGRPWLFVLAAFFLGLVGLSKLSVLPIGIGLLIAFASVFGLRKAALRHWLAALIVGLVPVALLFGSNYLYDGFGRLSATIYELSQTAATQDGDEVLGVFGMMSHMGRFFFTVPEFDMDEAQSLVSALLFCVLMFYGLWLALGKTQRTAGRRGYAFCAIVVLFGSATYFYLYRYRAESYPGPCLLPFACVVVVAFFDDLLRRLRRYSRRAMQGALLALVLACALFASGEWRSSLAWYAEYPLWFQLDEQKKVADLLQEKGIRRPLIFNSNLIGLFEFISYGELRPSYLPYSEGQAISPKEWEKVLERTREAKADFLFPARCEGHCASCRNNPEAHELFLKALAKSGRTPRETVKILDRQGRPMVWLERL